jgi:linoleoyl-CoA desaturase
MNMKKINIKFSPHNKPEFINELREKVKEYFEKNNISKFCNTSMVIKSFFMISLYFAPYVLMMSGLISSLPGILICWIIMGIGMAGIGMSIMHDANHGTYSKNPRVNSFLSKSMYILGGYPLTWQYQHNTLHHGYTNIDELDEDIEVGNLMRFSPHKPLYKIHKYQHWYAWFFYSLMTISRLVAKDFMQLARYKKVETYLGRNKSLKRLLTVLIISKVLYYVVFLVIPLIVLPISWYWIVLSFLIMHFVSGLMLSAIFQTAHVMPTSEFPLPDANGNIENNWAVHQLLTTSDYSPRSRFFSWFIGGLNFQVEHHLFPNICHVHYKNISHLVKQTALKYNLPYNVQPNFSRAVYSHIKMLKSLGRE